MPRSPSSANRARRVMSGFAVTRACKPFPLFGQCKLPLAADWQSGWAAGLTAAPDPADRRGPTDIVMLRRRLAAHSTMNRGNHAFTQI
jgi:hypothetical protein